MIPIAVVVLPPLLAAEIMSRTHMTVHIVLLKTFETKKKRGLNLFLARRTISVMVKIRQMANSEIHIGTTLLCSC